MKADSPCVEVCEINPADGFCAGCRRNLDEIAAWGGMTDEEKLIVLKQLPARVAAGKNEADTRIT